MIILLCFDIVTYVYHHIIAWRQCKALICFAEMFSLILLSHLTLLAAEETTVVEPYL